MSSKTKVTVEKITPKIAQEILEGNTQNRNLRKRVVDQYASDMKAGLWSEQGDPIRINGDGTLLDGQHRLHAIIDSGKSMEMIVVRGVSKRAILTMDTGARRTFADVLRLNGYSSPTVLAAATRFCHLYDRGLDTRNKDAMSNPQLVDFIDKHSDLPLHAKAVDKAAGHSPIVKHLRTPLIAIRQYAGNTAEADAFIDLLRTGAGLTEGHPAHTLRRTVENYLMSSTMSLAPVVMQAITIKAWNAYVRGDDAQLLRFRAGGSSPEAFPRIEQAG